MISQTCNIALTLTAGISGGSYGLKQCYEVLSYKNDVPISDLLVFYNLKQIDSMLPWICLDMDHRRRQNLVLIMAE